jgi:hypothetical protein
VTVTIPRSPTSDANALPTAASSTHLLTELLQLLIVKADRILHDCDESLVVDSLDEAPRVDEKQEDDEEADRGGQHEEPRAAEAEQLDKEVGEQAVPAHCEHAEEEDGADEKVDGEAEVILYADHRLAQLVAQPLQE